MTANRKQFRTITLLLVFSVIGFSIYRMSFRQINETAATSELLLESLKNARHLEVFEHRGRTGYQKVFTTSDLEEIAKFADSLELDRTYPSKISGYKGGHLIIIADQNGKKSKLTFVRGESVLFNDSTRNLSFTDNHKIDDWLLARGIPPIDMARRMWFGWAPESVRKLLVSTSVKLNHEIRESIETDLPNPTDRTVQLLRWYGCGNTSWDEPNAFQELALELLSDVKLSIVVDAINSAIGDNPKDDSLVEGTLRFLSERNRQDQEFVLSKLNPKAKSRVMGNAVGFQGEYRDHLCKRLLEMSASEAKKEE